jgi:hypothetical protein
VDLKGVLLNNSVGPDAGHQRVLVDDGAARIDQRHQQVEGAAAELDRLAIGQ